MAYSESKGKSRPVNQARKCLIESLRTHFLPSLIERGFSLAQLDVQRPPADRRYVQAFPLGRLIRARESGVDQVSIQFATYGRNAFRINAGVVPPKVIIATHIKLPAVAGFVASGLSEHFEMYASPNLWAWFTWGWFSARHWPFRSSVQRDYEKLASRVAGYVPELELALSEGKLGPHMRRMLLPHYVPKKESSESQHIPETPASPAA
jgi:hypothetical protein